MKYIFVIIAIFIVIVLYITKIKYISNYTIIRYKKKISIFLLFLFHEIFINNYYRY